MKLFLLASLFLSSCAASRPHSTSTLPELKGLKWELDRNNWTQQERSGDRMVFERSSGERLVISMRENVTSAGAQREAKLFREIVSRLLTAEVDPYYGSRDQLPLCEPNERENLHGKEGSRLRYSLAAGARLVLDCHSAAKFRAEILRIHCAMTGRWFEIRYFYPASDPPYSGLLASCSAP